MNKLNKRNIIDNVQDKVRIIKVEIVNNKEVVNFNVQREKSNVIKPISDVHHQNFLAKKQNSFSTRPEINYSDFLVKREQVSRKPLLDF